ncbi:MAG: OsmC family protein [Phycisphaerales bacterium]
MQTTTRINGIDTQALTDLVERIKADPKQGMTRFAVTTTWKGGARSDSRVKGWSLGGVHKPKDFTLCVDEPRELLGTNQFANPQEYLFAAVNSCLMATFVAAASVNAIELRSLSIETEGDIDLRGFLAIDARVVPGYESVRCTFHVDADATDKQLADILEFVRKTSPNYYNLAKPVRIDAKLAS